MKKTLIGLIVTLLAICAGIVYITKKVKEVTNEKCCEKCKEKELKYYHAENDLCGELCSTPEGYNIRVQNQKNLIDGNGKGCKDFGYTSYVNTTNMVTGSDITSLDFYKK